MRLKFSLIQIKKLLFITYILRLFLDADSYMKIEIPLIKKKNKIYLEFKLFGILPYRVYPQYDFIKIEDFEHYVPLAFFVLFTVEEGEYNNENNWGFIINILNDSFTVQFGVIPENILKGKWKNQ